MNKERMLEKIKDVKCSCKRRPPPSICYEIWDSETHVDGSCHKTYGIRIIQREIGVTYTSQIGDISTKYQRVKELVDKFEATGLTYDQLLNAVAVYLEI